MNAGRNRKSQLEAAMKELFRGKKVEAIPSDQVDFRVKIGRANFLVVMKSDSSRAPVLSAVSALQEAVKTSRAKRPLAVLVVPYMGEVGQELCEQHEISWLDLSGNAHIEFGDIYIHVEGKPNLYRRAGRPSSLFTPKSSRIVRTLLLHHKDFLGQADVVRLSQVSQSFASKVLRRLSDDSYLETDAKRRMRPKDPMQLLSDWEREYDFSEHDIWKGVVAARDGSSTLDKLCKVYSNGQRFAATGLAGAWLYDGHVGFRLTTVYAETIDLKLLESHGFRVEDRGANVWIAVPNDSGVFDGATDKNGVPVVSPLQVYLDLGTHPERADEARDSLRQVLFKE